MGLVWVKLWKQTEVAGKAAKFTVQHSGQPAILPPWHNGQGSYLSAWHNGQGLRWASQATCAALLYWLVDDIWTSLGGHKCAEECMAKKFRESWTNSYQGLKAAEPGALGQGQFGGQGAITGKDNDFPPVVLPAALQYSQYSLL